MSFKPAYVHDAKVYHCKEEASESFTIGDLVYINTSGYLQECGADPTLIAGIAAEAGNNSTQGANKIAYYPILPGQMIEVESNTTTAEAHRGNDYGVVDDSGTWRVDISDTSNTKVQVFKLDPRDATGTSNGRYYVTFLSKYLQHGGGNV